MFLSAPPIIQPKSTPAELAETIPLTHEEKRDEANATLPVKYVSKFNPRIYKNKRRAVRDTGEKTYVSMGVQSDYLPILTYSGPVDPVNPVYMLRLLRSREVEWQGNMFLVLETFSLGRLADTGSSQT